MPSLMPPAQARVQIPYSLFHGFRSRSSLHPWLPYVTRRNAGSKLGSLRLAISYCFYNKTLLLLQAILRKGPFIELYFFQRVIFPFGGYAVSNGYMYRHLIMPPAQVRALIFFIFPTRGSHPSLRLCRPVGSVYQAGMTAVLMNPHVCG